MSFDINQYFEEMSRDDYQRDNFDEFLKKVKFQYNVPSIHVAGTNGKGSTATYIANIYRAHGLKVGLFTSPYLDRVNEMININGQDISDEELISAIQENQKMFEKFGLSPFEIQTFIAFNYFSKNGCDLAVIECGMGGEIDATNIFTPIASVITSISLEHTAYLGRSLCEIAYQKAGIIKEGVMTITGILNDEAKNTIVEVTKEKRCPLHIAVDASTVVYENGITFSYTTYQNLHINTYAIYSLKDACISIETVVCLMETFPVKEEEIRLGLANTVMPVRLEIISKKPSVILDGSHNPDGMLNMTKSLQIIAQNREIHALFACFKDKNIDRMLAYLGEYCKDITLTTFPNKRAKTMDDYFLYLDDHAFKEDAVSAYQELVALYPDDIIIITGSLAFAAYMKKFIK